MSPRPASPARERAAGGETLSTARARGAAPPPPDALDSATLRLLEGAARLEKHPLARLITVVEQEGEGGRARRAALFRHLHTHRADFPLHARVIGMTGTPGSGKSTLIGRLALELLRSGPSVRVAVLAIDPS